MQELNQTNHPLILEGNSSAGQEEVLRAFDVMASNIGKILAVTALAAEGTTSVTAGYLTQRLNNSQQDRPEAVLIDPATKTLKSYFDYPFKKNGLVTVEQKMGGRGGPASQYKLTHLGYEFAAALAGELIRIQLKHPTTPLTTPFGSQKGRASSLSALNRLELLNHLSMQPDKFTPASSIIGNAGSIRGQYVTIEALFIAGLLERRLQADKQREFRIRKPQATYSRTKSSKESLQLYDAAMEFLGEGTEVVSVDDLFNRVQIIFPDVDIHDLQLRFNNHRPGYLTPVKSQDFSSSAEKITIRITLAYRAIIAEVINAVDKLASYGAARKEARQYGQHVLAQPAQMVELMRLAFGPEEEVPLGIVAPDYEGWHADRTRQERWTPQFPPR